MLEIEDSIYKEIKSILEQARNKVYKVANSTMVEAYWNIGRVIVEKQGGNNKAEYGTALIKNLSKKMTKEFGKGFTVANLKNMRQFYLIFQKSYALRSELTWTHYRLLMRVENENARNFYIEECIKSNWSTRQLERQITTLFYERLLSSKDKEKVSKEIFKLEPQIKKAEDIIKDPYVLEFLGLPENTNFLEKNLEQALIDHLQKFLLELGRGFSFVARQKRITFDGRHFYIDLVFYNYLLKYFILTIGIVLCADKSDSIVKYTLSKNETQVFALKYKAYLPSEEELLSEIRKEYNMLKQEEELGKDK